MDLYPTLGDLAGVATPPDLDGRSLAPILAGKQTAVRETSYSVYRDYCATVTDGEWKLIRWRKSKVTGRGVDRSQLFHIAEDKWELHDLANRLETTAIQAHLLAELHRWQAEIHDPQHYA
jgi:arylsulfatase A-like enzyme